MSRLLIALFIVFIIVLSFSAIYNALTILYARLKPTLRDNQPIRRYAKQKKSFTVLLPAYHEEHSISKSIKKIAAANYPTELVQILILCRQGDLKTIIAAAESIIENDIRNAQVLLYKGSIPSKLPLLNVGLKSAVGDLKFIFDTRDDVRPNIFNTASRLSLRGKINDLQLKVGIVTGTRHLMVMAFRFYKNRVARKSYGIHSSSREFFNRPLNIQASQIIRSTGLSTKFVQFGVIGGSVFGLGMALLYVLIEVFNVSPLVANAIQLTVTFWLNYLLNRRITWRDRTVSRLAAQKFLVSRAATTALNYLLFALLISTQYNFVLLGQAFNFSVNYFVANIICLLAITVLNYQISDRWTFAQQKQKTSETRTFFHLFKRLPPIAYAAILLVAITIFGLGFNPVLILSVLLTIASLALFAQSSMEVWRTVYSYREPGSVDRLRFPIQNGTRERFCVIVPARHESAVLADTLRQLSKQTHSSVSIITVICDDDHDTLRVAHEVEASEPNIRVIVYPMSPTTKPSKPKQLNYVFNLIKNEDYSIIGVVDAEDTVQPALLMHIDAAFRDRKIGVVQGGVQLINHDSSWYSLHNVLEYYRWFNSSMAFQADNHFMPLGGNTVFVRRSLLKKAGGWPDTLTEDCSLGVLLSTRYQTKTAVYYDPLLATREETPDSLKGLFKQRVRWNQGFFHEWRKGVWRELPSFRQRLLADYVLLSPVLLAGISVFLPVSLITALFLNAPVSLVMLMYLPLIPISLLMILNAVFLRDFGKDFERNIRFRHYAILLTTQVAYQVILNAAAFWAVVRELRGDTTWYKTPHTGKHRTELAYPSMNAGTSGISLGGESLNV